MTILILLLVAVVVLAAAAHAQWMLRLYTVGGSRVKFMRLVLAALGVTVGYIATSYASDALQTLLAFMIGFGGVHAPAAAILCLKHKGYVARH
jgi:hypothetical protein